MPDEDDRFGDVAEQLKQTEVGKTTDDDPVATEEIRATTDASVEDAEADTSDPGPDATPDSVESGERPSDGPPFPFDVTAMHGFYVRDETWTRVTRMRSSVTAACSMFDVPEFEGREFQDACLRVVAEHGDEVALQILRERGVEADEARVQEVVDMLRD